MDLFNCELIIFGFSISLSCEMSYVTTSSFILTARVLFNGTESERSRFFKIELIFWKAPTEFDLSRSVTELSSFDKLFKEFGIDVDFFFI